MSVTRKAVRGAAWTLPTSLATRAIGLVGTSAALIFVGLAFMVAVTLLGIQFINAPQLIYFSNPLDKPRPENWAGITLGALALWLGRILGTQSLVVIAIGLVSAIVDSCTWCCWAVRSTLSAVLRSGMSA